MTTHPRHPERSSMRIQWYGQSAFALSSTDTSVFVDPFGDMSPLAGRGMQFDYPAIEGGERRSAAGDPRAPRPQRGRGDRGRPYDPALDGGQAGVPDR